MNFIDLRSDTVTQPTQGMRDAIYQAVVGDDVYGEDKVVNELQEYTAHLLGKEAALFVPTGVMGNQICIALHTNRGDEVLCESEAHIFHYETSAPAIISGVQMYCLPSPYGEISLETIESAIRPPDYYYPKTALLCLENSHNRHGGTILSLDYLQSVSSYMKEKGISFHCDGARIWNTCASTGISPADYAEPFDTLSVCLSKGLGAPAGSVIVGKREHIEKARKLRKILGGGMRQSGIIASAGLYALENHRTLLLNDNEHANIFAKGITEEGLCTIVNSNGNIDTNIVIIDCGNDIKPSDLIAACKEKGLLISTGRGKTIRAVFHFQVSKHQTEIAQDIFLDCLRTLLSRK